MAGAGELGAVSSQRARVRASRRRIEWALRRNAAAVGRTLGFEDVLSELPAGAVKMNARR